MNTHELARILLSEPDLPVATCALGFVYMSAADRFSHGPLRVGVLSTYAGEHIVIGNFSSKGLNVPNWYVTRMIHEGAKP